MAAALNLTPNTKAQHMAKYSTPLVVIFAVVLTVATGATLVELNRQDALNLMSLQPDLAIWMLNISCFIGISAARRKERCAPQRVD